MGGSGDAGKARATCAGFVYISIAVIYFPTIRRLWGHVGLFNGRIEGLLRMRVACMIGDEGKKQMSCCC